MYVVMGAAGHVGSAVVRELQARGEALVSVSHGSETARRSGELHSMFPSDLPIPMVAPEDLGKAAAARLVSGLDDVGVRSIEGPARLTSAQVADIFARVLGREVRLVVAPRDQWEAVFRSQGFSAEAAKSYARMTGACIDQGFDAPADAWRWTTTLEAYLRSKG